ncbi:hypothetical protein Pse7367_2662 [Thalassoporum mexicanum PCC 7367]|uniref:hypothetical protein n=1 Tax=Thalassoporum mexicanum TaxID=3457544 RepID=UPI00029F953D|nr:hypothetical protein [Pseudanabaena sp. PCC 7367]AFY70917.1 hypothetical protein Pse7367_2662 [Pseudanabaena sp. PCC 7367]
MRFVKNLLKVSLGTIAASAVTLAIAAPSHAQPAYGSYVGIGASFGLTDGNVDAGEESTIGGLIAARYKFLEIPISVRGQVLIGESTAFVPTVSYDIPVNFNTDIYVGAGVALANTREVTPVGNENSFVIQPGIDYTVPNSNLVVFGNAIFAFDAFRNSDRTATALQTGLGFRF